MSRPIASDVGHERATGLAERDEDLEGLGPCQSSVMFTYMVPSGVLDPPRGALEQVGAGALGPSLQVFRFGIVHLVRVAPSSASSSGIRPSASARDRP